MPPTYLFPTARNSQSTTPRPNNDAFAPPPAPPILPSQLPTMQNSHSTTPLPNNNAFVPALPLPILPSQLPIPHNTVAAPRTITPPTYEGLIPSFDEFLNQFEYFEEVTDNEDMLLANEATSDLALSLRRHINAALEALRPIHNAYLHYLSMEEHGRPHARLNLAITEETRVAYVAAKKELVRLMVERDEEVIKAGRAALALVEMEERYGREVKENANSFEWRESVGGQGGVGIGGASAPR